MEEDGGMHRLDALMVMILVDNWTLLGCVVGLLPFADIAIAVLALVSW